MNILDKDVFVENMLKKVKGLNDTDLSDFFSSLNGETEQIFSNIYNSVFINKICDINKSVLNGLLSVFLSSDEDLVNAWIVDQIIEEVPDTKNIVNNLKKLNLSDNNGANTKIEFDENYLHYYPLSVIKNSQKTLFELFNTNGGIQELAKNDILSSLGAKLSDKELGFFDLLIKKLKVLDYDINNKNITVEVNNIIERFIYGSIRDQLKPLKLINKPNEIAADLIEKLNTFVMQNYSTKDGELLLEIVDTDLENKTIFVKWNDLIAKDNIRQDAIIENIKSNNVLGSEEQDFNMKNMDIETVGITYLQILQQHFIKFLRESKIGTQYHTIAIVKDFSLLQKSLLLSVSSEAAYTMFDEQLVNSELAKNKKNLYFSDIQFFYRIEPSKKQNNEEVAKEKIINNKSKIVKCPISLPIDKTKDLDTFYTLDKNKVQNIVDLLNSGKNIAINGERGSGKTHFVQSIANNLATNKNVIYTTGDKFCSEYWALGKEAKNKPKDVFYKGMTSFLDSFDGIDILILDGIDALGGTGKVNTQDVLKRIILKYPNMKLIFTSRIAFKDIPWMRKKITMDKTTYSEPSTIFDEIFNLNLVVFPELKSNNLSQIVQNQWQDFLNKKNNLFLPKELPEGIINLLAKKINPALYEQVFTSIDLNLSQDCSISYISSIVQSFVSEKLQVEPDEIINIVVDSILDQNNGLSKIIGLENMKIDISMWDRQEILRRMQGPIKADTLESIVLRLAIFFIKQHYPKKTFTDIGMYFNGRNNCGVFYKETLDRIIQCKEIDSIIEKNIKKYTFKLYGINN